ncbi:hypothetical protein DFH27DRAFT_317653 [Peziza echinospora]|nr:hypothetical protein DFH27DRAFT_317653 [Peziza echinospora]
MGAFVRDWIVHGMEGRRLGRMKARGRSKDKSDVRNETVRHQTEWHLEVGPHTLLLHSTPPDPVPQATRPSPPLAGQCEPSFAALWPGSSSIFSIIPAAGSPLLHRTPRLQARYPSPPGAEMPPLLCGRRCLRSLASLPTRTPSSSAALLEASRPAPGMWPSCACFPFTRTRFETGTHTCAHARTHAPAHTHHARTPLPLCSIKILAIFFSPCRM